MQTIPAYSLPSLPPHPARELDPNAKAAEDGGLFGLGFTVEESRLVAIPVPYDVTCSSRHGTLDGPRALLQASGQVDLLDPLMGDVFRHGLCALPELEVLRSFSQAFEELAEEARQGNEAAQLSVDAMGHEVWRWLEQTTGQLLDSGRIPLVLGGEHGVSFGAFRAVAARHREFGVLQIDAHADLRHAYEGWRSSHASVMARALELPQLTRLVQVGLRDYCVEEQRASAVSQGRSVWITDAEIATRRLSGESFLNVVDDLLSSLPQTVWLSVDIDGLDPSLCPGTGTPVPGGLSWREAAFLLERVKRSGRHVVGVDLVEIGPTWWDGFVAAKLLYLLAGVAT